MEESPLLVNQGDIERSLYSLFGQYSVAALIVFTTGLISWWISTRSHYIDETPQMPPELEASEWMIQLFGWTSAVCYCESRLARCLIYLAQLPEQWVPEYHKSVSDFDFDAFFLFLTPVTVFILYQSRISQPSAKASLPASSYLRYLAT